MRFTLQTDNLNELVRNAATLIVVAIEADLSRVPAGLWDCEDKNRVRGLVSEALREALLELK
jgi:hypothetical protein